MERRKCGRVGKVERWYRGVGGEEIKVGHSEKAAATIATRLSQRAIKWLVIEPPAWMKLVQPTVEQLYLNSRYLCISL